MMSDEKKECNNKISWLKNIVKLILVFIIFILSFQGIQIRNNPNYIPKIFGYTYLNVLTGSMSPEFVENDLIIGKSLSYKDNIEIGDVITFKEGQALISHRVVDKNSNENSFVTKGDANNSNDLNKVLRENIVSKQVLSIPKVGVIVSKFHDFTFLALLWCILMYFIVSELIKEIKTIRALKTEKTICD